MGEFRFNENEIFIADAHVVRNAEDVRELQSGIDEVHMKDDVHQVDTDDHVVVMQDDRQVHTQYRHEVQENEAHDLAIAIQISHMIR